MLGGAQAAPIELLSGATFEITANTVQHLDFEIIGGAFTADANMNPSGQDPWRRHRA